MRDVLAVDPDVKEVRIQTSVDEYLTRSYDFAKQVPPRTQNLILKIIIDDTCNDYVRCWCENLLDYCRLGIHIHIKDIVPRTIRP